MTQMLMSITNWRHAGVSPLVSYGTESASGGTSGQAATAKGVVLFMTNPVRMLMSNIAGIFQLRWLLR